MILDLKTIVNISSLLSHNYKSYIFFWILVLVSMHRGRFEVAWVSGSQGRRDTCAPLKKACNFFYRYIGEHSFFRRGLAGEIPISIHSNSNGLCQFVKKTWPTPGIININVPSLLGLRKPTHFGWIKIQWLTPKFLHPLPPIPSKKRMLPWYIYIIFDLWSVILLICALSPSEPLDHIFLSPLVRFLYLPIIQMIKGSVIDFQRDHSTSWSTETKRNKMDRNV